MPSPSETKTRPVEGKPFQAKVCQGSEFAGGRVYDLFDQQGEHVATIYADADRLAEIVRLINASVDADKLQPEFESRPDHAFPQAFSIRDRGMSTGGLTKREWFAGQAVVGLYPFISEINSGNDLDQVALARITAEVAFQIADAMEAACSEKAPG